jgi:flagellar L-ring protein FlgH
MLPISRSFIMRLSAAFLVTLVVIARSVSADSLWDPESPSLFAGSGKLQVGDTVLVSIESENTLSYSSSRVDTERVSIELSGGEGAGLFSFLPVGSTSGDQSLQGSEALSIQTTFAVRVVGIEEDGHLALRGGRTITIQGKQESISLSGVVDPLLVGEDRMLPFAGIADVRLTYSTLLQSGAGVLAADDLVRAGPESPDGATAGQISLSDQKRDELILSYLNRLLDLIFE